jgi:hypothetical protein
VIGLKKPEEMRTHPSEYCRVKLELCFVARAKRGKKSKLNWLEPTYKTNDENSFQINFVGHAAKRMPVFEIPDLKNA